MINNLEINVWIKGDIQYFRREKGERGGREEISWIHKIKFVTRIHSLRARYNLFKCSHFWRHREIESLRGNIFGKEKVRKDPPWVEGSS